MEKNRKTKEMTHCSLYIKQPTKELWEELADQMGINKSAVFELLVRKQAGEMGMIEKVPYVQKTEEELHSRLSLDASWESSIEKRGRSHLHDSGGDGNTEALKEITERLEILYTNLSFSCPQCNKRSQQENIQKSSRPSSTTSSRGRPQKVRQEIDKTNVAASGTVAASGNDTKAV